MPDQNEVLDATVPDPNQAAPGFDAPTSKPYDPDRVRDQARKRIAYWSLPLLILLVTYAFVGFFIIDDKPTFEHRKNLVEMLLGPIIVAKFSRASEYV
jgi:ABC-type microcin C transport system permease subunit YejE